MSEMGEKGLSTRVPGLPLMNTSLPSVFFLGTDKLHPLTRIFGKPIAKETRNTERDMEGSKHGRVCCSLSPMGSCKAFRVSPIFNLMLIHMVSQRS